ncbi:hypothetical protein BU15DRAFT_66909 [Melanogaster broomeanus]|nr:hypothetical protein BU15DRAFT_66909 [Melanogaster broomeanus]
MGFEVFGRAGTFGGPSFRRGVRNWMDMLQAAVNSWTFRRRAGAGAVVDKLTALVFVGTILGVVLHQRRWSSLEAVSLVSREMGSFWSRLGAEVTVVEFLGTIGSVGIDEEVAKQFQRILTKQVIKFKLNTKVLSADKVDGSVLVKTQSTKGDKEEISPSAAVLTLKVSTSTLYIGVEKDNRGRIVIDDQFNISVKNIKCIGDVTFAPMFAHKAEEEGIAAVEYLKTGHGHVNCNAIPSVVYTHPEVAWVGQTEQDLKAASIQYKIGKFPFAANSRAKTNVDSDGFVKFLSEKEADRILGVHIIGPNAGEMISEGVLAMECKLGRHRSHDARPSHAQRGLQGGCHVCVRKGNPLLDVVAFTSTLSYIAVPYLMRGVRPDIMFLTEERVEEIGTRPRRLSVVTLWASPDFFFKRSPSAAPWVTDIHNRGNDGFLGSRCATTGHSAVGSALRLFGW